MSKERMVQVTKDEYENLIRDQHTVELLTEYIRQDRQSDPMICLLLGIKRPENHPEQTDLKKKLTGRTRRNERTRERHGGDPQGNNGSSRENAERGTCIPPEEPEKKSGRKKIDRGKVMALHNAGWANKKIADEMACSEWSVSMILKELSEEK